MALEASRRGNPTFDIGPTATEAGKKFLLQWDSWEESKQAVFERLREEFGVEEFVRADGSPINLNDVPRFRAMSETKQDYHWLGDFEQTMAEAMELLEETIRAQHRKKQFGGVIPGPLNLARGR
jgi:hypothetical protein